MPGFRRWRANVRRKGAAQSRGMSSVKLKVCLKLPDAQRAKLIDPASTPVSRHKIYAQICTIHPEARKIPIHEWVETLTRWESF